MNLKNLSGNGLENPAATEMVIKALFELSDNRVARRYHIPPVEDFGQVKKGRLPDNRAADFSVVVEDRHSHPKKQCMHFLLISKFNSRPSRHWRRRMVAQAKKDGKFLPRLLIYAQETYNSIRKKVAQVIRVFVNSLKREVEQMRHEEHVTNRRRGISQPYRTSRQRIACSHAHSFA